GWPRAPRTSPARASARRATWSASRGCSSGSRAPVGRSSRPGAEPVCGICGYWNVRSGRPALEPVVARMTGTLAHRGPDDQRVWMGGAVALGQRRLVVVDPEGGVQPMANEDGTVRVVFNGEIYNHAALRKEL